MLGNAKSKPANASDFSPPKRYSLTQKGTYQIRSLSGDLDVGFDKNSDHLTPVYQESSCIQCLFKAHQWGGQLGYTNG